MALLPCWHIQSEFVHFVSTWKSCLENSGFRGNVSTSSPVSAHYVVHVSWWFTVYIGFYSSFAGELVWGWWHGVCVYPAGSRGCHVPVIHMVIVRGLASAQPHIISLAPHSGSHCQSGQNNREVEEGRMLFVCLLACFVLFRGFCWSQ